MKTNIKPGMSRVINFFVLILILLSYPQAVRCGEPEQFTFVITSDLVRSFEPPYTEDNRYFPGACMSIRQEGKGAFMVSSGDLFPAWEASKMIRRFFGEDYLWYPVAGNHDAENEADMAWLREYNSGGHKLPHITRSGPPGAVETVYAFEYGRAHFAMLNVYYDGVTDSAGDGMICDELYRWLEEDLAANTKPVVFVVGHEPILSAPDIDNGRVRHFEDSMNQHPLENHRFIQLLHRYNAIYICGHTHNASFVNLNGVWQVNVGHSKGLNDKGAPSSYMRVNVGSGPPEVELWRDDGSGTHYSLHSKRLLHDLRQ